MSSGIEPGGESGIGPESGPGIEIRDLHVAHSRTPVLRGLSLSVARGEVVALAGPSGSGKSTLIRAVLGLLAPTRGTISIAGRLASDGDRLLIPPEDRGLAVVFQDRALWPHLTVHGNLAFGLRARGCPREQREQRIAAALDRVDLSGYAHRFPGQLSGGEQQRVAIARALVLEPFAILLDEPLCNLDVALERALLELIKELLEQRQLTALVATHSGREARALARRIVVIEAGRVVQDTPIDELASDPSTPFVEALARDMNS